MVTFSLKKKEFQQVETAVINHKKTAEEPIQLTTIEEAPSFRGAMDANDLPLPIPIEKPLDGESDESTQPTVTDDGSPQQPQETNLADVLGNLGNFDESTAVSVIKETMHTHNGEKLDNNFPIKADIFHAGSFSALDFFIWYNEQYLGDKDTADALRLVGMSQRINNSALKGRGKLNRVEQALAALKEEKQLEFALMKEAKGILH